MIENLRKELVKVTDEMKDFKENLKALKENNIMKMLSEVNEKLDDSLFKDQILNNMSSLLNNLIPYFPSSVIKEPQDNDNPPKPSPDKGSPKNRSNNEDLSGEKYISTYFNNNKTKAFAIIESLIASKPRSYEERLVEYEQLNDILNNINQVVMRFTYKHNIN